MGVTIHHALGVRKGDVKKALDRTQGVAEQISQHQAGKLGIDLKVRRLSDQALFIDIGHCETLCFEFDSYESYRAKEGWSYEVESLKDVFVTKILETEGDEHIKTYPDQRILWSVSFCKTQFGTSIVEHKWVADLISTVAAYARYAEVYDEGDYYHTGEIEDASSAIEENGALIGSISGMLKGQGWDDVVQGGKTKIKSRKHTKPNR